MTGQSPGPSMRSRLPGRLAVTIGCLALAAVSLFNGLDRLSADRPQVARWVPSAFASQAHLARARTALDKGEATVAAEEAERALAAAPLDPASSATLGAAKLALRDDVAADAAFRISGQLGWRIFYTQAYLIQRALAVGDYRVAALRVDALARQDPSLLRQRALLDPMQSSARGEAALIDRMARAPWRSAYAADVEGLPFDVLASRARLLEGLAGAGTVLGCDTIAPLVSGLISGAAIDQAGRVWHKHCPSARGTLIYDGNLDAARVEYDRNDFAWSFVGQSGISMVLVRSAAGSGRELTVDSSARKTALFMRQMVLAAPGRYRLTWTARNDDGSPNAMIAAQIFCPGAPERTYDPLYDERTQRWSAAVELDGACPAHWIGFAVKPGTTRFALTAIELSPVR